MEYYIAAKMNELGVFDLKNKLYEKKKQAAVGMILFIWIIYEYM